MISGDFFGWNFGLAAGGFGGLLIALIIITLMYVGLCYSIAEMSPALPHAGGRLAGLSTMVYSTVLFGTYFAFRARDDLNSRVRWAAGASAAAALAEVPLDRSKSALFGSRRIHTATSILFVPFAAVMLLMYDTAVCKTLKRER